MKLILTTLLLFAITSFASDNSNIKHEAETIIAKIEQVIKSEDNGYVHISYLVNYKGQKVIAAGSPLYVQNEEYKKGDKIAVIVQKFEFIKENKKFMQFIAAPELARKGELANRELIKLRNKKQD